MAAFAANICSPSALSLSGDLSSATQGAWQDEVIATAITDAR